MDAFEIDIMMEDRARSGSPYHEFLRSHDLSLGLYHLPAGTEDPQQPHTEDEIYYVVQGRGVVSVDGEDRIVQAGSTIFVGMSVEHRFHSITEDLTLLVVFAPPRRSRAT